MIFSKAPVRPILLMGIKRKFGWKRLLAIAGLCLVAAAFLTVWRLTQTNDMLFRGAPLRQWIGANTNGVDELDSLLGEVGTAALPTLIDLLREESWLEKSWMFVWDQVPYAVQRRFPKIQHRSTAAMRRKALALLTRWGPEAREAVPFLRSLLAQTKDLQLQFDVLPALAETGLDSPEALEVLKQALVDRRLQHQAAFALARLGPRAQPALPQLIQAIKSTPPTTAKSDKPLFEIMALAAIGKQAASAERVLIGALADADLRLAALHALKAIGPSAEAVSPMIETIRLGIQAEHYLAVDAFIHMHPRAAAAVPELKRLATNDNPVLRVLAAAALAHSSGHPASAVPALLHEIKQGRFEPAKHAYWTYHVPNNRFRPPTPGAGAVGVSHHGAAAWWLGEIGAQAAEALPVLKQQLERNDWVALIAAEAIWKITGQTELVVPTLVQALNSRPNRLLAIRLLGVIGPAAREAKPDLLALGSISISLRREVNEALEKIEPSQEATP